MTLPTYFGRVNAGPGLLFEFVGHLPRAAQRERLHTSWER